ncbi:MAG: ABC transporter permease [Planctomycetaceae bacterium]|jgi:putative ABC transport system permease protein|nr:ABC transporter permease [Planctomycetaceae bacterium]
MSLWKIAYRSIQHRSLSSVLTAFSLSLGVAMVVLVIVIIGVIRSSFNRGTQGYDLIIGPKGNSLDIVWSTVFYNRDTVGTVPRKYLDMMYDEYGQYVETAIPVTIGHHFKLCTIVGTTPDFFTKLEYMDGKQYSFSEGENFKETDTFAAIVGAKAAVETGLRLKEEFRPAAPGENPDGTGVNDHEPFKVVGILKPTGTPNDNVIFVNINGFYDMHGMSHENEEQETAEHADEEEPARVGHSHETMDGDYSAILVMTKRRIDAPKFDAANIVNPSGEMDTKQLEKSRIEIGAMALPDLINKRPDVQAISPVREISAFLENVIGNVQLILVVLAVLVVIVAGIGMMVSIYNTMNERRQEIAIMRALGARRVTVMLIIILESVLLSLGGGVFGMLIGHVLLQILGPWVGAYSGIVIYAWDFQWTEIFLIPGLVVLASIVGYIPAAVAYRQDVAASLKP